MKSSILLIFAFFLISTEIAAQEAPADTSSMVVPADNSSLAPIATDDDIAEAAAPTESKPLKLIFPDHQNWTSLKEGKQLQFSVKASGGTDSTYTYRISPEGVPGVEFDTLGRFSWTPGYDFVERLKTDSTIQFLFEVENQHEERISQVIDFNVQHLNRPPVVGELKPFYVRYNTLNTYTIESSVVQDADKDPIVFIPIMDVMPEGAKLSPQGEFSWKPSLTQFNQLREKPILLEFYVEDQPAKARTKGKFKIQITQQDLPPSIQMVPSQARFRHKEDATINLKFQLYDPNGESDISSFNMIASNTEVPAGALVKNTPSQYEFIWTPGYDFVKDPLDSLSFNITFYVTDRSNKQEERMVAFTILNAVNEAEIDQNLYNEYRATMVRAWDLMEQLKDAEEDLKKRYRRAKKGKKARSLTNASLGAATGVTPVVVEEPGTSKKITAIGGTAVMTIGTLEATEVIGRSTKDLVERLNYIIEKRNELQTKGDIYARKYVLKSARRKQEFLKDNDEFVAIMNLKGLVALELDAGWKNKLKPTNENIAKTFKDFSNEKN
ncbi:hypothetical protein D770_00370 [Flammeovirgaceae bacterium 311]|nr:hypothetical protein D770_00370 [Flammeovirgaceae bacterium 311]